MVDNKDKARTLYWQFACNYFFMGHDGFLDEYRSYHPTIEDERKWRKEYIEMWIPKISVDDFTALNNLTSAHAVEAIPHLIRVMDEGDSFAKLMFANAIFELCGCDGVEPGYKEDASKKVKELYQSISTKPVILTEAHKKEISTLLKITPANNEEEYVVSFARARLESAS